MPTKKPIVQTVLNEDVYAKFVKIAEAEKRSKSQMTAIAVEAYIKDWESKNGTIKENLSISKIG